MVGINAGAALQPPAQLQAPAPTLYKPEDQPQAVNVFSDDQSAQDDQVSAMAPQVSPEDQAQLQRQVQQDSAAISKMNPNSPDFTGIVDQINNMGGDALASVGKSSQDLMNLRIQQQPTQQATAKTLDDLRIMVDDLTPTEDLPTSQKILRFLPGGRKLRTYFAKYESNQSKLNAIEKSLKTSKDRLLKDNLQLQQEQVNLWNAMGEIQKNIVYAKGLKQAMQQAEDNLRAQGQTELADKFDEKVVFAVNNRLQDFMTQLAIAVQGYLSIDLIRKNNVLLLQGLDRAINTTMSAFRLAVLVSQAVLDQKLVLDKLTNLNAATENTMKATARMLHQNTVAIQQQAVNTTISMDTLKQTFGELSATLDEVQEFRKNANKTMDQNINVLGQHLQEAQKKLDPVANANGDYR